MELYKLEQINRHESGEFTPGFAPELHSHGASHMAWAGTMDHEDTLFGIGLFISRDLTCSMSLTRFLVKQV